jgi:CRISPR-associated Cas5-like protein
MEGFTAFFNHTFLRTAVQKTLPTPTYSTILGLISACSDKVVTPRDTRIGFEFRHTSESQDLERTDTRLKLDRKTNVLKQVEEQGIMRRYMHFRPQLDLYLTNLDLAYSFTNPLAPPCLGRSQDLVWITKVERVELTPSKSGNLGSTLIDSRIIKKNIPSYIVRCAEWFDDTITGQMRKVGHVGFYQAIPPGFGHQDERVNVTMDRLYHPSNMANEDDVIYLHKWANN